jgi:antitoxin VapB
MSMQIPLEVEQLARLAALTIGMTPEQFLKEAVEARASDLGVVQRKRKRTPEEIKAGVDAIVARMSALPVLDTRSDDEILGYNEHGLPE